MKKLYIIILLSCSLMMSCASQKQCQVYESGQDSTVLVTTEQTEKTKDEGKKKDKKDALLDIHMTIVGAILIGLLTIPILN